MKCVQRAFLLFASLMLTAGASSSTIAQVDTAWVRCYDGPANSHDRAKALGTDEAGNVYVSGKSTEAGTGDDNATSKYNVSCDHVFGI